MSARSSTRALRTYRRLFDGAARLAGFGAFECDLASGRLVWTDSVYQIFGLPAGMPLRRTDVLHFYTDESRAEMEAVRTEAIRTGEAFSVEARIRTARGELRWMRLCLQTDRPDAPRRLFGSKQDITIEKDAFERMRQMAEVDALTGLSNRHVFEARLRAGAEDFPQGGIGALVLIDLDRFKAINDRFGHLAGDACLRETAKRLRRAFPDAQLITRLGGDEFAVLLPWPLTIPLDERLARAGDLLSCTLMWAGQRISFGASLGAALAHCQRASQLFGEADEALYAAKRRSTGAELTFPQWQAAQGGL